MTVVLLDMNNVAMRSIHAMARQGLTSDDGVPTGPLLAAINTVSKHIKEEKPDKVVACWDGGRSSYRVDLDPAYKAHRAEGMDDVKQSTFALIKRFLTLAGIFHLERPGVEADDLIAYYWRNYRPMDDKMVIVSSDKDFLQLLITGQVEQVRLSSHDTPTDRWTANRVIEEMGCTPTVYRYALALAGDTSDGVPGIPRVGIKTAVKYLGQSENDWEMVLRHDKIAPHSTRARLNLRLVDLRETMSGLDLPDLPPFRPTTQADIAFGALSGFLNDLKMSSVLTRLYDNTLWRA